MRMLVLSLLMAVSACGPGAGNAMAHWSGAGVDVSLAGPARGGWCPASRTVLLDLTEDDRVAGLVWHYDSLVPGRDSVGPPGSPDSVIGGASVAARYLSLDEVRGYRSLSGMLQVIAVDSTQISAKVDASLQRVGAVDTVHFTAEFYRIPLTQDTTLCTP